MCGHLTLKSQRVFDPKLKVCLAGFEIAAGKDIRYVIGDRGSDGSMRPANINVMTLTDISSFGPS